MSDCVLNLIKAVTPIRSFGVDALSVSVPDAGISVMKTTKDTRASFSSRF